MQSVHIMVSRVYRVHASGQQGPGSWRDPHPSGTPLSSAIMSALAERRNGRGPPVGGGAAAWLGAAGAGGGAVVALVLAPGAVPSRLAASMGAAWAPAAPTGEIQRSFARSPVRPGALPDKALRGAISERTTLLQPQMGRDQVAR